MLQLNFREARVVRSAWFTEKPIDPIALLTVIAKINQSRL